MRIESVFQVLLPLLQQYLIGITLLWIPLRVISQQEADLIFHNGIIITVDEDFSTGEFLAIRDGRVMKVGNGDAFESLANGSTEVIDLNGRTIMPGFIEPHTHPVLSAALSNWVDVSGSTNRTAARALNKLKAAAQSTPKGEWILAFGWDFMSLRGAQPLSREYLDSEISDQHPIWVMMQSQHTHYFNTMALELAGITNDTPDPPGGGSYVKNDKGELTGMVTESATVIPFIRTFETKSKFDVKNEIQRYYSVYNSKGITTIGAPGIFPEVYPNRDVIGICEELSADKDPQVRLFYYRVGLPSLNDTIRRTDNWFFRELGQKYWIDGSPYTGSMLIREPYLTSSLNQDMLGIPEGSHGHTMYPSPAYQNLFFQAHTRGWQIAAHSQGDSAVEHALTAFNNVLRISPKKEHRYRLEHMALATPQQLRKMQSLGLTPSFHINHIYYYGDSLSASIIGIERAQRMMAVNSALKAGHKVSLHNDSPMYPPDPLLAIRTAVTRKTMSGKVLGLNERIDIREAIKAVTIYPAWQMHAEKEIGSLEEGKRADLVILGRNPLNYNPDNVHRIEVIAVFLEGKKVY